MKLFSEKNLHTFFDAGIVLKLIDSIGEVLLGILFIFLDTAAMNRIAIAIFGDETAEQPFQAIWNFTLHSFAQLSNNSQAFLAFIFISHGIIKLILIAGLAKDKLWVYPLAATAFTGFGIYQIYQITFTHSVLITALTILDAIFVMLIIHEYRYQKQRPKRTPQTLA